MNSLLFRGLALALVHCSFALAMAGKYWIDRERLPRVWARTAPADPNLPVRGRYVRLGVVVENPSPDPSLRPARLKIIDGRLTLEHFGEEGTHFYRIQGDAAVLQEPVAFFIPEHVADPSVRAAGEELWVEVSVPSNGPPRPIRLGVKTDSGLKPLDLD